MVIGMATFEFVEWLLWWLIETKRFKYQWDKGNSTKNKTKHDVSAAEVEEVFDFGLAIPLGVQTAPKVDEDRLGIIGPTRKGRLLHIVFVLREGKVRPISARPAKRKERSQYAQTLRKISQGI